MVKHVLVLALLLGGCTLPTAGAAVVAKTPEAAAVVWALKVLGPLASGSGVCVTDLDDGTADCDIRGSNGPNALLCNHHEGNWHCMLHRPAGW